MGTQGSSLRGLAFLRMCIEFWVCLWCSWKNRELTYDWKGFCLLFFCLCSVGIEPMSWLNASVTVNWRDLLLRDTCLNAFFLNPPSWMVHSFPQAILCAASWSFPWQNFLPSKVNLSLQFQPDCFCHYKTSCSEDCYHVSPQFFVLNSGSQFSPSL